MSGPIPHGTPSGYQYHRCRCDACRAVNAAYSKRYRSDQRAWFDKTNAETGASADSDRAPWSRSTVAQAIRTDAPVVELALQLGRSYSAVLHVRHKAANNPEWMEALPDE